MANADEFDQITISSRSFADRERTEAFCELFGRNILKLEMDPLKEVPFDVEMNLRALPGLSIATAQMSAMTCRHTSSMIDNDDPVLVFVQSGVATYRQNGHETTLRAGEAALTSNGVVGTGIGHTATGIVHLRISRSLIAPLVPNLDDAVGKPIDRASPELRLFLGYAGLLKEDIALASPEARRSVGLHLIDLSALMLGAGPEGAEIAQKRGVAAARLRSIKQLIVADIGRRDLTLGTVAADTGISTAYVRKLFETEGTTFTEFVLSRRLTAAYRMLTDHRLTDRPVSSIARDTGFNDLSYFNRTFRRAYGTSPSEVRGETRRSRGTR
ncbi:AraC family transcriptional regulator [Bradyrhizobium iriomotense]|uniref:AraC family transcriptional regulator n=1 Tax=Bradyrhizobium iriomotense TaxID=441950 RepID=A0ABQ6B1H6_9BRAD|nr:AraC family transcriptional regulator [Bradyrhizobium iriomotense]GLR87346.1 AraC family transcriptional regulator [Bradyrhizobium iriomotense]